MHAYLNLPPLSVLHQDTDEEVGLPWEDGERTNRDTMVVRFDGLNFNVASQSVVLADELAVPEHTHGFILLFMWTIASLLTASSWQLVGGR